MASDAFTRADETPLSTNNWASDLFGGINLISNTVGNAAAADKASYRTDSSVQDSQIKIATVGTGDGGPAICLDGSSNFYMVNNVLVTTIELYKCVAGVFTSIASVAGGYALNDTIRIRRSGGNVIISKNGTDILTFADSTFTTGFDGMHCFNNVIRMDDWNNNVGGASQSRMPLLGVG